METARARLVQNDPALVFHRLDLLLPIILIQRFGCAKIDEATDESGGKNSQRASEANGKFCAGHIVPFLSISLTQPHCPEKATYPQPENERGVCLTYREKGSRNAPPGSPGFVTKTKQDEWRLFRFCAFLGIRVCAAFFRRALSPIPAIRPGLKN